MKDFKIMPIGDRVIIKPIIGKDTTSGGIILPDTAKDKPTEGIVIAVGKGRVTDTGALIKPRIKVKETVVYSRHGGSEIKIDGEKYLIMSENDIYGVLKENSDNGV